MMQRVWFKRGLLALLLVVLSAPPALAVDLTDTMWQIQGRSRVMVRGLGHDHDRAGAMMSFFGQTEDTGAPHFEIALLGSSLTDAAGPLTGTWEDTGGRRFAGQLDDAVFADVLAAFIASLTGAQDSAVSEVRTDRIWGHITRDGLHIRMKVRFQVTVDIPSEGVEGRRAFVKMELRGDHVAGDPVF